MLLRGHFIGDDPLERCLIVVKSGYNYRYQPVDPFWSLITFYTVEGHAGVPFIVVLTEEDCPPMGDSLLISLFPHGHFIKVYPINAASFVPTARCAD